MATTEISHSVSAGAGTKLRRLAEASLFRLVALWRAVKNRRAVVRLLEWDDHMLRDIGLTQGDVRAALAWPVTDDPSYRLGATSVERRTAFRAASRERLDQQGYLLRTLVKGKAHPSMPDEREDRLRA